MKLFIVILGLVGLMLNSGCVIREGRGGDYDHHWHGYGHGEHWDHNWDHHDWH